MIQWPLDAPGSSELSHWFGLAGGEGGDSDALLCRFDISERILHVALQAWEHSVGIICFPSLQRLAEDVSNQLAQEIQKALVGKPAGERRQVLENFTVSKTAL